MPCESALQPPACLIFTVKNLLVLIVLAACVWYFLTHRKPAAPRDHPVAAPAAANSAPAQPATTPSNFLKRPTDRAREVTEQVRKRSGESF